MGPAEVIEQLEGDVDSTKATAHRAGLIYFVFMIAGIIGEFVLGGFVVPDDAAATVGKIMADTLGYRIDIMVSLFTHILFIFLIVALYRLFGDVDRSQARLMLLLVTVGIAVALANLLLKFAPLILLSGDHYLSVIPRPQLEALVLSILRWHGRGTALATMFWGLWLFPFGHLVIKSGWFPRILGVLLMMAGVGYVVTSATLIVLPEYRRIVSQVMMPLYFGEVPIIFWLLIKGARVPAPIRGE